MLVALQKSTQRLVLLPAIREAKEMEAVREHATSGDLVCRECEAALWLRAGTERRPHFAHRALGECPQSNIPALVQAANWLLFQFFHDRAERMGGRVELEPRIPNLPDGARVDLAIYREGKPPIAVAIIERNLKPDLRWDLRSFLQNLSWEFRPIFLAKQLRPAEVDSETAFLLDPTQREFRYRSPWGATYPANTLHFIDPLREEWTTLRDPHPTHAAQTFSVDAVKITPMKTMLWSNVCCDWVHPGETRGQRCPVFRPVSTPPSPSIPEPKPEPETSLFSNDVNLASLPPAWTVGGLVCQQCGRKTMESEAIRTGLKTCICKNCA